MCVNAVYAEFRQKHWITGAGLPGRYELPDVDTRN